MIFNYPCLNNIRGWILPSMVSEINSIVDILLPRGLSSGAINMLGTGYYMRVESASQH